MTTMMMMTIRPAIWFCVCSFISNAGVAITGFGAALIFLTVYTIGDITGVIFNTIDGDESSTIKEAVFLQSLSLVGTMPLLILQTNAFQEANPALLLTLIPTTLISTPIGQYCQTLISASWIKVVVGTVVTLVVLYKMNLSIVEDRRRQQLQQQEQQEERQQHDSSVSEMQTEQTSLLPSSVTSAATANDKATDQHQQQQRLYHGFSVTAIRLWGGVLGFLSGFLGGLIGMRGPPLMIFFLMFPFPKWETRAVGAIMLCLNMILRISYYILSDVATMTSDAVVNNDGHHQWFKRSEWLLYVGVIGSGMLGTPIGNYLHQRLNQTTFQQSLGLLLISTGILNIWKGATELTAAATTTK